MTLQMIRIPVQAKRYIACEKTHIPPLSRSIRSLTPHHRQPPDGAILLSEVRQAEATSDSETLTERSCKYCIELARSEPPYVRFGIIPVICVPVAGDGAGSGYVLQPAQWRVRTHDAWYADSMSEVAFFQAVQAWRDSMKVPQLVFLSNHDNRMLLDLTQRHHVEEIRRELKQAGKVTLIETGQLEERSIVRGPGGAYASEFVFSLVRREPDGMRPSGARRLAIRTGYEGPRIYLPGSEWMYMKLYGNQSRQEELIATKLLELLSSVTQQGLADKAYFLRYSDPEMHLRLRLHGQPDVLSGQVMPLVHQWSTELMRDGMLSKMVLDSYEPEVERYGGPELMKLAEQVFHADSVAVVNWVKAKRFGALQLPFDLVGVMSVLDYLEQFGFSFREQVELMDKAYGKKDHLDLFRTYRKDVLDIAHPREDRAGLRAYPDGNLIHGLMKFRAPFVKRYAEEARVAEARGELFGSYLDLVFSVIHMHMNRLYGIDREQERKVMILTRHALQAMKYFRAHEVNS